MSFARRSCDRRFLQTYITHLSKALLPLRWHVPVPTHSDNDLFGQFQATTRALHSLHFYGLLRVARRRDGIRIYEAAPQPDEAIEAGERLRRLLLLVTGILAPLPQRSLRRDWSLGSSLTGR